MFNCISSDIGGTNSRFFLHSVCPDSSKAELLFTKIYSSDKHDSLEGVLGEFLKEKEVGEKSPKYLTLSIAGTPKDNVIRKFANLPWPEVSGEKLEKEFGFEKVFILNDFEVIGHAIPKLKTESLVYLQKGKGPVEENYLVIGSGTGLGMTFVTKIGAKFRAVNSEGGHIFIGATNDLEKEYEQFILEQYKITEPSRKEFFAEAEDLSSGSGLPLLYDFVHLKLEGKLPEKELSGKQVNEKFGKGKLGEECLKLFMRFLGRICNATAKVFLVRGGRLILVGNFAKVLESGFEGKLEDFWKMMLPSFVCDPYFEEIFSKLDIGILTSNHSELAVDGCLHYLKQEIGIEHKE